MIRYFAIFFLALLIPLSFSSAFGDEDYFTTDKFLYYEGDIMYISGIVPYDTEIETVKIQIISPWNTFTHIEERKVKSDGSFSTNINVGGPLWNPYGIYLIKVFYDEMMEKSIEYKKSSTTTSESTPEPSTGTSTTPEPSTGTSTTPEPSTGTSTTPEPSTGTSTTPEPPIESHFTTLKLQIPNFPSLDKSPQHYIDQYANDDGYKSWFDSQFPFNSINDIVGYKLTPVDNFPSLDKSPQYYIDRYNNEPNYKSWFDSQFPNTSIYNILGYADPVPIPDWIRDDAESWATGDISDSKFVKGIEFMLKNNIIMISNIPSGSISGDEIPDWVRNTAHWWYQDLISEDEFVNSLKFLIEERIIEIN